MTEWKHAALCGKLVRQGKADPEWWFPQTKHRRNWPQAERICRRCPVWGFCRREAARLQAEGVWGGEYIPAPKNRRVTKVDA